MQYNFYQIKSEKSVVYHDGYLQFVFACRDRPDMQCFVWKNREGRIEHIQFIFDENVLEWFESGGVVVGVSNRRLEFPRKLGVQKGVRTIHATQDRQLLEDGLVLIEASQFPEDFDSDIKSRFKAEPPS